MPSDFPATGSQAASSPAPAAAPAQYLLEKDARRPWNTWADAAVAVLLAALSFLLLRLFRFPAPYPDESVWRLLEVPGVWPRATARNPFWHAAATWLVGSTPGSDPFAVLQTFAFILLSLAVGCAYLFAHGFAAGCVRPLERTRASDLRCRFAACIGAAGFLVAPPVWAAAQSARPELLPAFVTTLLCVLFLLHLENGAKTPLLLAALLGGVGVLESSMVLLALPPLALSVFMPDTLFHLGDDDPEEDVKRREKQEEKEKADATARGIALPDAPKKNPLEVKSGRQIPVALFVVLFAVVFLLTAWWVLGGFYGTRGYIIRKFTYPLDKFEDFVRFVRFVFGDYLGQIKSAIPSIGWLIVAFLLVAPALLGHLLAARACDGENHRDMVFFFLLAGLGCALQTGAANKLSVWPFFASADFRIGSSLLVAYTLSLSIAVILRLAGLATKDLARSFQETREFGQEPGRGAGTALTIRRAAIFYVALAGIGTLFGISVAKAPQAGIRKGVVCIDDFTKEMVADCDGMKWLFTDGVFDAQIRWNAWKEHRELRTVCLSSNGDRWNRLVVDTELPDQLCRNLYAIGPSALVRDWVRNNPDRAVMTATQIGADLWIGSSYQCVPTRTLFLGGKDFDADVIDETDRLVAFWDTWRARLDDAIETPSDPRVSAILLGIERQLSLLANETGVLLEDRGHREAAGRAYTAALDLFPSNISATLNLLSLRAAGVALPDGAAQYVEDVLANIREMGRVPLALLSRYCGTIRNYAAQQQLGIANLSSLDTSASIGYLEKALSLARETAGKDISLVVRSKSALALNLCRDGDVQRGLALADELLRDYPQNGEALLGGAVVHSIAQDWDGAFDLVRRAREAGEDALKCDVTQALVLRAKGDHSAIVALLAPYLDLPGEIDNTLLFLLGSAAAACQNPDPGFFARLQSRFGNSEQGHAAILRMLVQGDIFRGENMEAITRIDDALHDVPDDPWLLAQGLHVSLAIHHWGWANTFARKVVVQDPANLYANYALGMYSFAFNDYQQSIAYLERCEKLMPSNAVFPNNLAYAHLRGHEYEKAQKCATRAVALASGRYEVWDTLAEVSLALEDLDTAASAVKQAEALNPDAPEVLARRAELLIRQGRNAAAALDSLDTKLDLDTTYLSTPEERLEELKKLLP